jgi:hypothetical protein
VNRAQSYGTSAGKLWFVAPAAMMVVGSKLSAG